MRIALALALLLFPACSDTDSPPPDAATYDAALGYDASEVLPDAAATTSCGTGEDEIDCFAGIEICVNEDLGGTIISTCEPIPTGCDARDCANCDELCQSPADTCDDDAVENSISCVCLAC